MELVGNCHGTREVLLVRQFQITSWMPSYYVQRSGQNCGIVLADIYCAYRVNHVIQFLASSRHFPVTFSQLSRDWLEDRKYQDWPSNCQELVPNLLAIHYIFPLNCHFLIAG